MLWLYSPVSSRSWHEDIQGSLGLEPLICACCVLSALIVLGIEQVISARGALAVSQPKPLFCWEEETVPETPVTSPSHSDFLTTGLQPGPRWLACFLPTPSVGSCYVRYALL